MSDFEKYMIKTGYDQTGPGVWSRKCYVTGPKCQSCDMQPLVIVQEKDDAVDLHMSGLTKRGMWVEFYIRGIDKDKYPRAEKEMHDRLNSCWRDMN